MNPPHLYIDYLEDLLEALRKSQHFVVGIEYEEFIEDDKTVFAVIRALEVVGEAAKQIPQQVREKCPQVPWRDMGRMRDKLTHHYFGVDLPVVWKTVREEVPVLIPIIEQLLVDESGGEP